MHEPISPNSFAILCRWAREALRTYDRVSGGGCTELATIHIAAASLAHLADSLGADGAEELNKALHLYLGERRNNAPIASGAMKGVE